MNKSERRQDQAQFERATKSYSRPGIEVPPGQGLDSAANVSSDIAEIRSAVHSQRGRVDSLIPFTPLEGLEFKEKNKLIEAIETITIAAENCAGTCMATYPEWEAKIKQAEATIIAVQELSGNPSFFQLMKDERLCQKVIDELVLKMSFDENEQKLLVLAYLAPACKEALKKVVQMKVDAQKSEVKALHEQMRRWDEERKRKETREGD